jgi:hypothetical protein
MKIKDFQYSNNGALAFPRATMLVDLNAWEFQHYTENKFSNLLKHYIQLVEKF